MRVSPRLIWGAGLPLLIVSALAAMLFGAAALTTDELFRVVSHALGFDVEPLTELRTSIVTELRLPRVLMAMAVGAALAVSGACLQVITGNDLAEPYLLGISSGASTGAVVVLVLGIGSEVGMTGGAVIGALIAFVFLMAMLGNSSFGSTQVVLSGVLIGQLFAAITSLILMAAGDAEKTRGVTFWLLGAMGMSRWPSTLTVFVVALFGIGVLWSLHRSLDALTFGASTAASLGINVALTRRLVLIVVAGLTAASVAAVGAIGFVGLIIPHAVRFLVGPLHRQLLPLSALAGAIFLVWTDALARSLFAPQEVPVGVFTALVGVPVFFVILRRKARE